MQHFKFNIVYLCIHRLALPTLHWLCLHGCATACLLKHLLSAKFSLEGTLMYGRFLT